jgi:hypothetical protein
MCGDAPRATLYSRAPMQTGKRAPTNKARVTKARVTKSGVTRSRAVVRRFRIADVFDSRSSLLRCLSRDARVERCMQLVR